jgi:hypothetical protein
MLQDTYVAPDTTQIYIIKPLFVDILTKSMYYVNMSSKTDK